MSDRILRHHAQQMMSNNQPVPFYNLENPPRIPIPPQQRQQQRIIELSHGTTSAEKKKRLIGFGVIIGILVFTAFIIKKKN